MKIPSISQQVFGDLNRQLNSRRRQMNAKIRGEILERLNKKMEAEQNLGEPLIGPSDLNKESA